ncbi:MAG TPA: malic enzyme-like NAD(P)-binding protein, partial [Myxococcota bacterium]|nr:malic enzyme-like NAD(P)-binding protein [Myxococcota bacterium]
RQVGARLRDQRVLVHGAGAGGVGVAEAIRQGMLREGLSPEEALARIFVLDSKGLLTERRKITGYKAPFAQPDANLAGWSFAGDTPDLLETIREGGVTVLLGLSGQAGAFSEAVCRATAENTPHPFIFPLSNPTSSCEAIPTDVFAWTGGRAKVATGSPFDPVPYNGDLHPIGQGNNAFIFPGLGMAAILGYVTRITDAMVMRASDALVEYTAERHPGLLYPPVAELAEVSVRVATRVLEQALADGVAQIPERWVAQGALDDLEGYVRSHFFQPRYLPVVKAERRAV